MSGIFYVVATPIGNLEDITLRGISILSDVDIILAEDTRVTSKLTERYQIKTPITSYHQHSDDRKKLEILQGILAGKNIALVTDAGTPGISDPGNELISFLLESDPSIKVVPIPGPSAIATAMSVSGLNVSKFVFLGFLPKKGRTKLFSWLKIGEMPFSFYESPFRLKKTLSILESEFGTDTRIVVARELTKLYETLYRGSIGKVKDELEKGKIKGEIVVIIEP